MKKVALCLRGAIGKKKCAFTKINTLYHIDSEYIDYVSCYNSIKKHILEFNHSNYEFDIYCQCWNTDLQENIINLYKPVKYIFEDNCKYNKEIQDKCIFYDDFSGISQSLAIKKVLELKEEHELEINKQYDLIIIYRYDILLWKNMDLNNYSKTNEYIYVNAHPNSNGDFHFIMNNDNSKLFKFLYNSIDNGNKHKVHYWIKNYVIEYMKKKIIMDDIEPGKHQEVMRKIYDSIKNKFLSLEQLNNYKL